MEETENPDYPAAGSRVDGEGRKAGKFERHVIMGGILLCTNRNEEPRISRSPRIMRRLQPGDVHMQDERIHLFILLSIRANPCYPWFSFFLPGLFAFIRVDSRFLES